MSIYSKRSLLKWSVVLGSIFCYHYSHTQGLGNAPYSAIGLGEILEKGYAPNNGMGDVGVSNASGMYINAINPALLVRNPYTTFDVGIITQYKGLQDARQSQRDFAGNLGYLSLCFPVAPKWSLGFSLKPYSIINYQQNSYGRIGSSIYEAQYLYSGKGALNQINFTNSFQLTKSLSIGADVRYLFGNINKSATSQLRIGDGRDYIISRDDRIKMSDLNLKLGAAWRQKLGKEKFLNFGTAYELAANINASRNTSIEILSSNNQPLTNADTILLAQQNIKLPATFRVGLSYEKLYRFLIGFDYERQDWNNYVGIKGTNEGMRTAQSYHVGIEYLPKYNSTRYTDLVTYRAGFVYRQTPLLIGTTPINDMSATFGISLPIGRELVNTVNLSIAVGQRGSITTQTFRERYARISLGFSLKDVWFQKFRVD